jgi:hypothetical protein
MAPHIPHAPHTLLAQWPTLTSPRPSIDAHATHQYTHQRCFIVVPCPRRCHHLSLYFFLRLQSDGSANTNTATLSVTTVEGTTLLVTLTVAGFSTHVPGDAQPS